MSRHVEPLTGQRAFFCSSLVGRLPMGSIRPFLVYLQGEVAATSLRSDPRGGAGEGIPFLRGRNSSSQIDMARVFSVPYLSVQCVPDSLTCFSEQMRRTWRVNHKPMSRARFGGFPSHFYMTPGVARGLVGLLPGQAFIGRFPTPGSWRKSDSLFVCI